MPKTSIRLTDNRQRILENIVNNEKNKSKVRKAKVILMRNQNVDINTIMKNTKLSKRAIIYYTKGWLESELRFIHQNKYPSSELEHIKNEVIEEFVNKPPLSYKEATDRIEMKFGIKRSQTQIRSFLNKHDIHTLRTRKLRYSSRQKINKAIKDSYLINNE